MRFPFIPVVQILFLSLFATYRLGMAAESATQSLVSKTLVDKPGQLVLEITSPSINLNSVAGQTGSKAECQGCFSLGIPGAPDVPVYSFNVLAGTANPSIQIRILESQEITVEGGLAPYPLALTPKTVKYEINPELYQKANLLEPRFLGIRSFRGLPVQGIEIPLSRWSEATKSLTFLKKIQVELTFSGLYDQPSSNRLPTEYLSEVKNPIGGVYLHRSMRLPALQKSSAKKITLGNRLLKIKIGDRNLENLDEDRVYGFSYADLVRYAPELAGAIKIGNLRIYTGGNDTLPTTMTGKLLSGTLREIPIEIVDRVNNAIFDEGDTLRFYAHGTSIWQRIPGEIGPIRYAFKSDPYSYENFYYLDYSGEGKGDSPLRLKDSEPSATSTLVKTSGYAYLRAEKDLETAACDLSHHKDEETGFLWHWHWKGIGCQSYAPMTLSQAQLFSEETDSLPDFDSRKIEDSLYVGIDVSLNNDYESFRVYAGGKGETLAFLTYPTGDSVKYTDTVEHSLPVFFKGNYFVWTKGLDANSTFRLDSLYWPSEMRFNGYTISYRKKFNHGGKPFWIFPTDFGKPVTYKVESGKGLFCLRVEGGIATKKMLLDGDGQFTDSLGLQADAKYFIYRFSQGLASGNFELQILPPTNTTLRNLETGDGENPEYLIITNNTLREAALELKNYRNQKDRALNLKTSVVLVEDIYRQFSSGRMSPVAIRDFIRWAYNGWSEKSTAPGNLKYVLLFGDGHYDFREIRARFLNSIPPNIIPPYEFFNGGSDQIATDDFYAALDSNDNNLSTAGLDLAVGRLPIQTQEQARAYLQKVQAYEDPKSGGEWRSRVVIAADDDRQRGAGSGSTADLDPIYTGHTTDSDNLGKEMAANEPGITLDKVYLLDYAANSSYHKPEAAQDLLNLINRGTLLVNYVGHGASNQWADEVLMQTNNALSRMQNVGKTPMINSFSCTVGRFESLSSEGMSEQFVKTPRIGAIATISGTRETYPDPNIRLASAFYANAFLPDTASEIRTVGQALTMAKNSSSTSLSPFNDAKYALLGEPVLLLRKPKLKLILEQSPDTLSALDCSTIQGKVDGGSGSGYVNIKIIAGSIAKTYILDSPMVTQKAEKRGNILFERTFPYKENHFSTEYFIPKQIPFNDSTAQIQVYVWDGSQEREGSMAKQNLHILGTAKSSCADADDGKGPHIRITGCQIKETGDIDFPDQVKFTLPYCLQIQVLDSTGGVLSSQGPDEGTTIEVPGVIEPFHPQPGLDELQKKTYQFSLDQKSFRPGRHLLKVSARDGYGNYSARQILMDLTSDSSIQTVSAYNIPNPMKRTGTTFYFSTIIPTQDLEFGDTQDTTRLTFEIKLFNQSGRLIKKFEKAKSGLTSWDGRDEWGQLAANGAYFYRVTARQNREDSPGTRPGYRILSSKRNILILSR